MADPSPEKKDEQHPLLKVYISSNDTGRQKDQQSAGLGCGWKVSCSKSTWIDRWPELVSACWMTLILFGITFLVCCGLGLGTYTTRLQSIPLVRTIADKSEKNVFFHNIVKYNYVPISYYDEYLTTLGREFPSLNFNVYFLLDDSLQYSLRKTRHGKFMKKFFQRPFNDDIVLLSDRNRQEINEFQRKVHNVNITVMPLSKYMSMTPIKDKWKSMSLISLPFYARICSVWEYGGIAMDLSAFSHPYGIEGLSRRAIAVLKQHNDGKAGQYYKALNTISEEEDTELFRNLFGFVNQLFRETRSIFLPLPTVTIDNGDDLFKSLVRTHRNKREITKNKVLDANEDKDKITKYNTPTKTLDSNTSHNSSTTELYNNINVPFNNAVQFVEHNVTNISNIIINNDTDVFNKTVNQTHQPMSFFMFYDFSLSDPFNVDNTPSQPDEPAESKNNKDLSKDDGDSKNNILLDSDGLIVASALSHNAFLEKIILGDSQGIGPRCIIKNSFIAQCLGSNKQSYCKNVKVI